MNYYEHHLGDYAAATAHLTWDEDMAYSRLIRAYYHHEKPIPIDMKSVWRLVRATTSTQRQAVETVLQEFFDLLDDGWHQKRCDSELGKFADKQSKAKRSANERWAAHRAHFGGNANADANASPDAMRTHMRTHSEGNALQTPDTRHQSQPPGKEKKPPAAAVSLPPDVEPSVFADFQALRRAKKAPLTATALDGLRREASKAGLTLQQAIGIACERGWVGFKAEWFANGSHRKTDAVMNGNIAAAQRFLEAQP